MSDYHDFGLWAAANDSELMFWLSQAWYVLAAGVVCFFVLMWYFVRKKTQLDDRLYAHMKRERVVAFTNLDSWKDAEEYAKTFVRSVCSRAKEALDTHGGDKYDSKERAVREFLEDNNGWSKVEPALIRLFQVVTFIRLRIVIMEQGLWDEFWEWYKDKHNLSIIVLLISTVSIIALCAFCLRPSLSCRTSPPLWGEAAHERGGTQSEGRY